MSEHDQEHGLRELAYRLWEEAGCPDGRADEFWYTALEILTSEPRPPEAAEAAEASEPADTAEPAPPASAEAPAPRKVAPARRKG